MAKRLDLNGQRFGRLLVLKAAPDRLTSGANRCTFWECQCDCGAKAVVQTTGLRKGTTKSCGCFQREGVAKRNYRHGHSEKPEYGIWLKMIRRCTNPSDNRWHRYGGRGIKVCERWAQSFESFYADMGPRPSARFSIERINNDKGYEPGNCRWATKSEQARNTRRTVMVQLDGQQMCLSAAAAVLGVSVSTIASRIRRGWTGEAVFAQPSRSSRKQAPTRLSKDLTGSDDQKSSNPETLEQLRLWDSAA